MSASLASAAWPACISALRLDRWMAGELEPADGDALRTHVAGCDRCARAVESLRTERDGAALPPLRAARTTSSRPWRIRAAISAAAALAAAAGLVLFLRTGAPGDVRPKGSGVRIGMYVLHGGAVREAGPGDAAAPGDAVRFSVTTPQPAYVAVLSVDPAGRASIYFPQGPWAAPVAAGTDVPLPLATRLDATIGEERILGLFCDRPVELEPVRASLEGGGAGAIPAGCQVTRWSFVKR